MSGEVILVREFRGGPHDRRIETIHQAELGDAAVLIGGAGGSAIYRHAGVRSVGKYIYHFYDFVKAVTDDDQGRWEFMDYLRDSAGNDQPAGDA